MILTKEADALDTDQLMKNLLKRILSALVLMPLAIGALWAPLFVKIPLVLAVVSGCLYELLTMAKTQRPLRIKPLGVGLGYILFGSLSLTYVVIGLPPHKVLWLMISVWVTDIMAFVVGSLLKGPQFAPRVSPKKTWSGFLGGVLSAMGASYVYAQYFLNDKNHVLWVSLLLSVSVHYGDLLESWLKRRFQVKDSGGLIPGHGGIFDRVDGLLAASMVFAAVHFMWV